MKKDYYVYVVDIDGTPLMPTKRYGKVKALLKEGKAVPVCNHPFTIRLKYKSTGYTQPVHVGIDTGRENIGVAASDDEGNCLFMANVETKNKSIRTKMDKRRGYRRERRSHKRQRKQRKAASRNQQMKKADGQDSRHHGTKQYPYREVSYPGAEEPVRHKVIQGKEAKFNNRHRPEGWLTPSARQLVQMHEKALRFVMKFLPVSDVCVERVSFDLAKLQNVDIKKWQYSKGPLYGYKSANDYIDAQQHGKCLVCGVKKITHHHHVLHRNEGGSDKVKNIVGLCDDCHDRVHKDVNLNARLVEMKAEAIKPLKVSLLNSAMPAIIEAVSAICDDHDMNFHITAGRETAQTRDTFGLEKDHCLDAFAISLSDRKVTHVTLCRHVWTLRRFKKKSNNLISSRGSRTYWYKGRCVAVNRHKATEQNAEDADTGKKKNVDSLEEYMAKYEKQHGKKNAARHIHELEIRPAKRVYTVQKKGIRVKYHPGDVVVYEKTNKIPTKRKSVNKKTGKPVIIKSYKSYKIAFVVWSVNMCDSSIEYDNIRTGKRKNPKMKFCRFLEGGCLHSVKIEKIDDHIAGLKKAKRIRT